MSEINPYTTPQADLSADVVASDRFGGLEFKQLRKLYHRSCNVNAIAFLMALGFTAMAVMTLIPGGGNDTPMTLMFIGLTAFYAVALVGLFKRTGWGRILGIIVSILCLASIPIGTIVGVCGLFAFFGAPQLFGADRITHRELKLEYKLQKANMKVLQKG